VRKSEFYREARRDLPGPLAGVRVVEATTTWAGPMCGCLLADFGADVIKVEHPAGDVARRLPPSLPGSRPPLGAMQVTVNRNKRSLSLDLARPRGRDLFLQLVAGADLVVENFRPGTMERFGLGYRDLRAMNEDVVLVSISGFGQFGRDSDRRGYDPLAQAASGFLSLNGEPDGGPVKAPTFLGDDLAGLHAALAALAALHHRDRTGEGQHVDVSLLDAMLFQTPGYLTLGALGAPLPRLGNQFRIAAPANLYPCQDGAVMAGVLLDSHWRVLARLLERPELAEDPAYATAAARLARRDVVDGMLAAWTRARSVAEVLERFRAAGLPAAPVQSYAEAARDPHVADREMLQETDVEGLRGVPVVGPAAKFSRTPTAVRSGAPALGAHTDEILAELGVDAEERAALRRDGVI
jgi:crotonobetainyl-CoA:carnitine CoA-transferase CaiB-like acyl-CoA transferase